MRQIYAFWHSVLNDTEALCFKIDRVPVTMKEWHRQRAIYDIREDADLGELGFAAFFLNRTNRSGIIGGGVIGGKSQTGQWMLDARFTKAELIRRIRRIGRYRNRIRLYQQDALDFTNDVVSSLGRNVFAFYDPPYIDRGEALYLNAYTIEDHRQLAARVARLERPWVVTYDYDAAMRHDLYPNHPRLAFELSYSAQDRYKGKEAMFLSDRLSLPPPPLPMSPRGSGSPVYATVERMKKPHPEMEEGPEAGQRFSKMLKALLTVPKDSLPELLKKPARKKNKPASQEG